MSKKPFPLVTDSKLAGMGQSLARADAGHVSEES